MSIMGVGPSIALSGIISTLSVLALKIFFHAAIAIPTCMRQKAIIIGVILCATGTYFWLCSIVQISKAYKSHSLYTKGVYSITRNPMYAAFIVFIVPGVSMICNNLLVLIVSGTMYIVFKYQILKEEEYLKNNYGDDYYEYERNVSQLVPFIGKYSNNRKST